MREILPYYNQLYASEKLEYDPLQNVNNTHTHNGTYVDNSKTDKIHTEDFTETRNLTTVDDGSSSFDKNEDTILRHEKATNRGNDTQAHTVTAAKDQWTMFSDTPQGGIDGVSLAGGSGSAGTLADNAYLTSATHVTESPAATLDTSTFGTVTETFNPNGDKKDHVDADGWEKTDNTNTHTGTVRNAGERIDDNKRKNDGENEYTKKEYGKIGVETYQEMQMKWRESFLNIDMQIIDELSNLFMKVW